jgi:hypothetical protein
MSTVVHWVRFFIILPFLVIMIVCNIVMRYIYPEFWRTFWGSALAVMEEKHEHRQRDSL